jgi:hypothetical protein
VDETLTAPETVSFRRLLEALQERDFDTDNDRLIFASNLVYALVLNEHSAEAVAVALSSIIKYKRKRRKQRRLAIGIAGKH